MNTPDPGSQPQWTAPENPQNPVEPNPPQPGSQRTLLMARAAILVLGVVVLTIAVAYFAARDNSAESISATTETSTFTTTTTDSPDVANDGNRTTNPSPSNPTQQSPTQQSAYFDFASGLNPLDYGFEPVAEGYLVRAIPADATQPLISEFFRVIQAAANEAPAGGKMPATFNFTVSQAPALGEVQCRAHQATSDNPHRGTGFWDCRGQQSGTASSASAYPPQAVVNFSSIVGGDADVSQLTPQDPNWQENAKKLPVNG